MHSMTWLALGSGGGGIIGVWLGGYLADRLGVKDKRWYLWIPAISLLLSIPLLAIMLVITNIVVKALWATYLGPIIAMAHGMVGLRMRALASAVLFLFLNLIVSDYLAPTYGIHSIKWAMCMGFVVAAASSFLYWRGSVFLEEDLARAPK